MPGRVRRLGAWGRGSVYLYGDVDIGVGLSGAALPLVDSGFGAGGAGIQDGAVANIVCGLQVPCEERGEEQK